MNYATRCVTTLAIDKNKMIRKMNNQFVDDSDPIPVRIIKRAIIKRIVRAIRVEAHISEYGIRLEVKCDMPRDDNKILP
jgi:hypothetical protein